MVALKQSAQVILWTERVFGEPVTASMAGGSQSLPNTVCAASCPRERSRKMSFHSSSGAWISYLFQPTTFLNAVHWITIDAS
jgi:hypothetical protein